MTGKKQLWRFTLYFIWFICILWLKQNKHVFVFRGNAASASEMAVDCTELRCCNQEPLNSGAANDQCLIWQGRWGWGGGYSACLWPKLWNKFAEFKNNLLKERGMAKDCNTGEWRNKAPLWQRTLDTCLNISYIIDIPFIQRWMGSCGSDGGRFEIAAGRSRADTGGVTGEMNRK